MIKRIRPDIPDPYPDQWSKISDFHYNSRLELGRDPEALMIGESRESCYMTLANYTVDFLVDDLRCWLTVPAGMLTDLTSVPRIFRNVVGRVGPHLEAAIVHDYLYVAWQLLPLREARRNDWRFANQVMFAGLRAAKIGWVSRRLIRTALLAPYFSWSTFQRRDDGADGLGLFVAV